MKTYCLYLNTKHAMALARLIRVRGATDPLLTGTNINVFKQLGAALEEVGAADARIIIEFNHRTGGSAIAAHPRNSQ